MGGFRRLLFYMDWQFFDVWCGLPNYLPMSVDFVFGLHGNLGYPTRHLQTQDMPLSPPRNVLGARVHSVDVGQPIITHQCNMQDGCGMWCVDRKLFFISVLSNS